jgi:hypothetical protein
MAKTVPSDLKKCLYRLYSKPLQLIELYLESPYTSPSHFYVGNTSDTTFGGQVYTAIAAKRTSIKSEEGTVLQEITVQLDNIDLEFKTLISSGFLNKKRCDIKLVFQDFLTNSSDYLLLYSGVLDAPSGDNRWVSLLLKPFPIFEREYPRRIYQVGCNWVFCDAQCALTLTNYHLNTSVGAGMTPTASAFYTADALTAQYFVPGYIIMTSGICKDQVRPIYWNDTVGVTLRIALDGIPSVGDTLTLQKICAKNPTECRETFNNYLSFGGFPQVPLKPTI